MNIITPSKYLNIDSPYVHNGSGTKFIINLSQVKRMFADVENNITDDFSEGHLKLIGYRLEGMARKEPYFITAASYHRYMKRNSWIVTNRGIIFPSGVLHTNYIDQISNLEHILWDVGWDKIEYNKTDYPKNILRYEVKDEIWIRQNNGVIIYGVEEL